ncbi:nitroreductase [Streptomyces sp. P38-E01]|uniref:Nitroreductase n=1 Tax=Streptomyces tardus TaxID=2780544 RepID=A0A949N241_9ACTN|nr:nitroreductase [Streptomyces tardus]MBU7598535.1 nitroreductase [Streptomyces tardus]
MGTSNGGEQHTAHEGGPYGALRQLLDGRWTCRRFRPEPVPRETVERLLRLAQRTPSWCNTQPWQVELTEGAGTERFRAALLEHVRTQPPAPDFPFPEQYAGVYRDRRRACGFQLYDALDIARDDREGRWRQTLRNFELFDAPHVALVTTEADLGVYGAVDCGLYLNSFLLAAQSLGLGAAPQAALASYAPFVREHFGLPENRRVVAGVSFGHPDLDHPVNGFRTAREDVPTAVTWHPN